MLTLATPLKYFRQALTTSGSMCREDFVSVAKEATGGSGVDVILDMIGGSYAERNQQALAAVAKTRTPKARASWIAVVPMPLGS